jgi:hypothetical protein
MTDILKKNILITIVYRKPPDSSSFQILNDRGSAPVSAFFAGQAQICGPAQEKYAILLPPLTVWIYPGGLPSLLIGVTHGGS